MLCSSQLLSLLMSVNESFEYSWNVQRLRQFYGTARPTAILYTRRIVLTSSSITVDSKMLRKPRIPHNHKLLEAMRVFYLQRQIFIPDEEEYYSFNLHSLRLRWGRDVKSL